MINLHVKRTVKLPVDRSIILQAALLTLEQEKSIIGAGVSIVVGDDLLLKKLNLQYRNVNATTDVLAFSSSEPDPDTNSFYLGDVVISLPRAQEQASSGGHTVSEELQLLVVHGTLHLLGYDHQDQAGRRHMQYIQEKILGRLGVRLSNTL